MKLTIDEWLLALGEGTDDLDPLGLGDGDPEDPHLTFEEFAEVARRFFATVSDMDDIARVERWVAFDTCAPVEVREAWVRIRKRLLGQS